MARPLGCVMFKVGDQVGNLELRERIGSGAFGVVFRAFDVLLERECAVKFVQNKDPQAFKEHLEGKILNHYRLASVGFSMWFSRY